MNGPSPLGNVVGVIPARMASSRFPGKPLASILGRPMIYHVWQRARISGALDRIIIATCDEQIAAVASGFGAEVLMTSSEHVRSNDRVAEVASRVPCDIILNVQGDEPLLHPQLIADVVSEFAAHPEAACVNPVAPLASEADRLSPNTVKVVYNLEKRVVYFSRCPIPSSLVNPRQVPVMRQVPILGFRRDFCMRLASLPVGPLELQEGIDLLRAIDHDLPVHAMETTFQTHGVDTEEERAMVEQEMRSDPIWRQYETRHPEAGRGDVRTELDRSVHG